VSVKRVNGLAVPTPPLAHRYTMDAAFVAPWDGDSAHVRIRMAFKVEFVSMCRFARVQCAELKDAGGPEARDFTTAWLAAAMAAAPSLPRNERDWPLIVQGRNLDIRSRPLVELFRKDTGANISDDILTAGFSKVYALTIWRDDTGM
jgi:hypothetical protein